MALGRLHAERLEADILGVRDDADRDDGVAEFGRFGLAVLGLDLGGDAVRGRLQFLDAGAGEDRHALFLERLFEEGRDVRSEEHTSELQSLMRISYAVFCLKQKNYQS